jgi:hypothetical protein
MVWGIFTDTITLGAQLETVRELAPDAFDLVADHVETPEAPIEEPVSLAKA